MHITQKQKVINRFNEVGYVDNLWAIDNYMLRLGAIIHDLKKDGLKFVGKFGTGKNKKNYYYYLATHQIGQQFCCGEMKAFGQHYSPCKEDLKTN